MGLVSMRLGGLRTADARSRGVIDASIPQGRRAEAPGPWRPPPVSGAVVLIRGESSWPLLGTGTSWLLAHLEDGALQVCPEVLHLLEPDTDSEQEGGNCRVILPPPLDQALDAAERGGVPKQLQLGRQGARRRLRGQLDREAPSESPGHLPRGHVVRRVRGKRRVRDGHDEAAQWVAGLADGGALEPGCQLRGRLALLPHSQVQCPE
mmetsp:Transcript_10877/g.36033  ORF Transcript_10877/g.36033 Transcript_10877/m.36033 type:complete len:207 (-) Transcript_10877:843-1463(-)|eukprot:scaffold3202_cov117-Isochrysis_galbana.AAC.6